MNDIPNTTARRFAGYYRELVTSGVPRGLAQSRMATAAANDRVPSVHPDALASVDAVRDKVLADKAGRAESMRRHPAGKQPPKQPGTRGAVNCQCFPKPVFDEAARKPGPKARNTTRDRARSSPVVGLNVYDTPNRAALRAMQGPVYVDFMRGR